MYIGRRFGFTEFAQKRVVKIMSQKTEKESKRQVVKAWTMVLQLGLIVIANVAVFVIIGMLLDHFFGWSITVWMVFVGLICGLAQMFRQAYTLVGKNDENNLAGIYERLEREKRSGIVDDDDEDDEDEYVKADPGSFK